jgi:hypothetical protein
MLFSESVIMGIKLAVMVERIPMVSSSIKVQLVIKTPAVRIGRISVPTITETMIVEMDKKHVTANLAIVEMLCIVSVAKINVEMDRVPVLASPVLSIVEMIVVNIKILMIQLMCTIVEVALMVNCAAKTNTVRIQPIPIIVVVL